VIRTATAVLLAAALATSCTGDDSAAGPGTGPEVAGNGKPVCRERPGRGVEGFVLVRTRQVDEGRHVALREEYRDGSGRRLFYLLGLHGGIGEGLVVRRHLELVNGHRAAFLGRGENWIVVYRDRFPCPQVAVIGNGFRRGEFLDLLVDASILPAEY
jgi:hypothetical protein